jgi:hypothetical protein
MSNSFRGSGLFLVLRSSRRKGGRLSGRACRSSSVAFLKRTPDALVRDEAGRNAPESGQTRTDANDPRRTERGTL